MYNTTNKDNNVPIYDIYNIREDKQCDGMQIKEALHYIRHNSIKCANIDFNINHYAKVGSELALKQAIISNGPCLGALPVYNSNST